MQYNITKEPSEIEGLSYLPILADYSMDADGPPYADTFYGNPPNEVLEEERHIVRMIVCGLLDKMKPYNTMEIGVDRNGGNSFTHVLLNKHPFSKYLGVDINAKHHLDDYSKHIYTLQTDSANQELVRKTLIELDMVPLSILFIDGWHSVNMVINDFAYSDLVEQGGYVLFHDTNMHPGPRLVTEALDRSKYELSLPLKNTPGHYGIGIARKL